MNAPTPSRRPPRRRRAARGFTLIEVLISILIFSVGILGTAGMQARALQVSTQNQDRARAALMANEVVSQMWANQTTSLNSTVLTAWNGRVGDPTTSGLSSGQGSVSVNATTKVATVTVTWRPVSMLSTSNSNQFVTSVVLP